MSASCYALDYLDDGRINKGSSTMLAMLGRLDGLDGNERNKALNINCMDRYALFTLI